MHRGSLVCPVDRTPLRNESDREMICPAGHRYPVTDGVPVLLRSDVPHTMRLAMASLARAKEGAAAGDPRALDLYLESLGISEKEKELAIALARSGEGEVDPVVNVIVGATSGYAYKQAIGKLTTYPIPELRLPPGDGKRFLDIGCNWRRWSIAAARKGYKVTGIDPSLGAIMAARRVARKLGLEIEYIVADARHLPFEDSSFETVFSYSVLQHFEKTDVASALSEAARALAPAGTCLIQMAHAIGVRSLYHQLRRGFREARGFEVRYWTIPELRAAFARHVGPPSVSVHCYFGLGLEPSDRAMMPPLLAALTTISEALRRSSRRFPAMAYLADSLYVSAVKGPPVFQRAEGEAPC